LTKDSFLNAQSVEEVMFEQGSRIRRLASNTFAWCTSLRSIVIPASVEVIERDCFIGDRECSVGTEVVISGLETVTFEAGSKLREIESGAFQRCYNLLRLSIPATVEKMTWAIFYRPGEATMDLEPGNPYFERRDDFLVDIRRHILVRYCGRGSDIVIPDEIEEIGECSFMGCETIHSVRFGRESRLSSINRSGFLGCVNLMTISIPSTVTFLGQSCFFSCEKLRAVSFCPGSLLGCIPTGAFHACTRLRSIVLPSSVKTLEDTCFLQCGALVDSPLPVDSQVVRIGNSAFCGCESLGSMDIPSSVEYIGAFCFMSCESLLRLTFSSPSTLRELLSFPIKLWGSVSIPDSVEVLRLPREWRDRGKRTLVFGRDSRLAQITVDPDPRGRIPLLVNQGLLPLRVPCSLAFLHLSSRSLKLLRKNMEFAIEE
jgi:hypothetical protein